VVATKKERKGCSDGRGEYTTEREIEKETGGEQTQLSNLADERNGRKKEG